MRALVTGASGFVGRWLCAELLERGWDVTGTAHGAGAASLGREDESQAQVRWVPVDVTRPREVGAAIDTCRPDAIFHLAGVAFVPEASADPGGVLAVNVVAAAQLLAEIRVRRQAGTLDPVVLVVGSGLQYGRHGADEMPLSERAEQRPLDLYAASKAAQEILALEAYRSAGVRVVATRSFNHSGPGQEGRYLLPRLVREAIALRRSGGDTLRLGNVAPIRDFLHVADVARAYALLGEGRGRPGEVYNVASGAGLPVRTVAERVLALAGVDAKLHVDASLQRATEVPVLVGDAAKLRAATGWTPRYTLDTLIGDLIRAATC